MYEEKKSFLKQYLIQQTKIERLEKMQRINPEFSNRYKKEIRIAKKTRLEIEGKISEIPEDVLRELLFQKYIFGKTLEEISYILNYSKRHIERLHNKALEKLNIKI